MSRTLKQMIVLGSILGMVACIQVPDLEPHTPDMRQDQSTMDMAADFAKDMMPDEGNCSFDQQAFCATTQKCGPLMGMDTCNTPIEVNCGCAQGADCVEGVCRNDCETDTQLCFNADAQCSPLNVTDTCGQQRQIDCGTCTNTPACITSTQDDSSFCGNCAAPSCTPEQCGWVTNNCGDVVACEKQCNSDSTCQGNQRCVPSAILPQNLDGASLFGSAVAMSAKVLAISAIYEHKSGLPRNNGAVYIYERATPQDEWIFAQTIYSDASQQNLYFGTSIAVADDTLIVGSPYWSGYQGKVWIFKKSGTKWVIKHSLINDVKDGPTNGDVFGDAVCITSTEIIVGMPTSRIRTGSVHVYDRRTFAFKQTLVSNTSLATMGGNRFGDILACDETKLAVVDPTTNNGEVLVFKKNLAEDMWSISNTIRRKTPLEGNEDATDLFARDIALSGNHLAISTFKQNVAIQLVDLEQPDHIRLPLNPDHNRTYTGNTLAFGGGKLYATTFHAHLGVEAYTKNNNRWTAQKFGAALLKSGRKQIAIHQNTMVITGPYTSTRNYSVGTAHSMDITTPLEDIQDSAQPIIPEGLKSGSFVGSAAIVPDHDTILAGGPAHKIGEGSVFVFSPNPDPSDTNVWISKPLEFEGKLTPELETGAGFGQSILVNQTTLIIGAPGNENSRFLGEDEWRLHPESSPRTGRVYILKRNTPTTPWRFTQVVEGESTTTHLGQSLTWINDITFAVGAPTSAKTNDTKPGRVYIYRQNKMGNWVRVQTIESPMSRTNFGHKLSYHAGSKRLIVNEIARYTGLVHVYTNKGGPFVHKQSLSIPDMNIETEYLGYSFAQSDEWVAIGDYYGYFIKTEKGEMGKSGDGLVHLFKVQTDGELVYSQTLGQHVVSAGTYFGYDLAFLKPGLLVSAPYQDIENDGDTIRASGLVHSFLETKEKWSNSGQFGATVKKPYQLYGWHVNATTDRLFVGAPAEAEYGIRSGSFYVYDRFVQ